MSNIEDLMFCEDCGAEIAPGELGTTTINGGHLCFAHTPLLSEIIHEYNSAVFRGNYRSYQFSSLDQMKEALRDLTHEFTTRGNCNVAVPL